MAIKIGTTTVLTGLRVRRVRIILALKEEAEDTKEELQVDLPLISEQLRSWVVCLCISPQ